MMSKSSPTVYTYEYTVPGGSSTQNITISQATDLIGNVITAVPTNNTFVIDNTAPDNQNDVFSTSISVQGGANVTIVSSVDVNNEVWFAPSGTTSFATGNTMTTAGGTATTIQAPNTEGAYYLYVIDAGGNVSTASTAALTVPKKVSIYRNPQYPPYYVNYKQGDTITFTATFNTNDITSVDIAMTGVAPLAQTAMTKSQSSPRTYTYQYTVPAGDGENYITLYAVCLLYTSPSPRD